jgi:hypothetical protein
VGGLVVHTTGCNKTQARGEGSNRRIRRKGRGGVRREREGNGGKEVE